MNGGTPNLDGTADLRAWRGAVAHPHRSAATAAAGGLAAAARWRLGRRSCTVLSVSVLDEFDRNFVKKYRICVLCLFRVRNYMNKKVSP